MVFNKEFLHKFDKNLLGKFLYLPSYIQSMKVNERNHLFLVDSNLPCDMFNILCCNGAVDLSFVKKGIEYFKTKQLPYAFWVGFEDEPSWLEKELQNLGFITDEMEWAMACDLSQKEMDIKSLDVRKVCNQQELSDFIYVLKQLFSQQEQDAIESFYYLAAPYLLSLSSRLKLFVGYQNSKPIASASVYFDEKIASIFDIIVLPQMRGKGFGKIMTQRAMLEAERGGLKTCILTATNDAKYLYQKLGFVDVKTMKVYREKS